jgi:hypothetical protein
MRPLPRGLRNGEDANGAVAAPRGDGRCYFLEDRMTGERAEDAAKEIVKRLMGQIKPSYMLLEQISEIVQKAIDDDRVDRLQKYDPSEG